MGPGDQRGPPLSPSAVGLRVPPLATSPDVGVPTLLRDHQCQGEAMRLKVKP